MTKSDLITTLAERSDVSKKEAERMVQNFLDIVTESLVQGEEVTMTGFGTFSVSRRGARTGVNPRTQEKIDIGPTTTPKFKAGKRLKDAVK